MLNLTFERRRDSIFRILCLGAHSDDIEIGCGGTVLRILEENPDAEVLWVVIGASGQRADEATASAKSFLARARQKEVIVKEFRDGFFPYIGAEIKGFFEELKRRCAPDLILTHCRNDLHQDHRLVADLTWNTFRNHLILEYEILKYDGDLGRLNLYVTLDEPVAERKVDGLLAAFPSQRDKPWCTRDTFLSLMRIRGVESNSPTRLAEGFYCRKGVI